MTKQTTRYDINDNMYLFQLANSPYWQVRFTFGNSDWHCRSTKKTDRNDAVHKAYEIFHSNKGKHDEGMHIKNNKQFKKVAELCIERMELDMENGGKKTQRDYIQALNKYHIPYFDKTPINQIDFTMLQAFDEWRNALAGRVLKRSTLQTHNAAFMRVFELAVEQKWMFASHIPQLKSQGETGARRAAFSEKELQQIMEAIWDVEDNAHKNQSKMIRELLHFYVEFAVNTGMRPGTEMEALTWGDIELNCDQDEIYFYVNVKKGKTTKYTGTRKIVCRDEILNCLEHLRDLFPNRKPSDKLFVLKDGSTTDRISRTFTEILKEQKLKQADGYERSLYSLRHTYITNQLLEGVPIDIIASQCGTSTAMIEQHYSHVKPIMHSHKLRGKAEPEKKERVRKDKPIYKERRLKRAKAWMKEYEARGCI